MVRYRALQMSPRSMFKARSMAGTGSPGQWGIPDCRGTEISIQLFTLALDDGPQGPVVDVAEGDRPVIALQHDRVHCRLRDGHRGAGAALHFHVVLHRDAVVQNVDKLCVLCLLAGGIEPRSPEPYVI